MRSLQVDEAIDPSGARVLVVGTGGAASSIIEAVGRCNPAELIVVSRNPERAAAASSLAPQARPGSIDDVAASDIVVNASPVGMAGGPDPGGTPVPASALSSRQVVVDIVYQPRETRLLAEAAEVGARPVNGVGMLVHQAAIAFEHWTGASAPLDAMRNAAFPCS